jgi:hypothetical protein
MDERLQMTIKKGLFLALVLGAVAVSSWAQGTYTAASCNQSDVNAVINGPTHKAVDGDTINIPSGTCTWSSQLSISVGISIIGAGAGPTTINDALNGTLFKISVPSATSSPFRLSSMTITPISGAGGIPTIANISGACNSTSCSSIRIDHITTTGWAEGTNTGGFLIYADNVFGVIDHNDIEFTTGGEFVGIGHSSYGGVGTNGDNSWAQPDSFGTANALYIEANTFSSPAVNGMAITDTDHGGGGRFVVRFNTLTDASVQTHGTESTGRTRGGRQYEVYSNLLTLTSGAQGDLIGWRSGTGLSFNNTKSGPGQYNSEVSLTNYRDNNDFSPWGWCDGKGPYDNNDGVTYASGTVSSTSLNGSTLSVTDNNKSWTNGQWVANPPYSIVDISITDGHGVHPGAQITSNTTTNVASTNYGAWNGGSGALAFNVGDTYQILRASACIDQAGRGGPSTLLSGSIPSPVGWVNEPLDPVYEWGSTISGGGTPSWGWVKNNWTNRFAANKDYYSQKTSFDGTTGTGTGTLANRPPSCTKGVAYWATDQGNWNHSGGGGQGQLYVCSATNTWTLYYTPYTYPHPLTQEGSPPDPPTNLLAYPQ